MEFNNKKEMRRYLKSYKWYYDRLEDLESRCLPQSPALSNEAHGTASRSKSSILLRDLAKKEELIKAMKEISDFIKQIDDDVFSYTVIDEYFTEFKTHEDIANVHDLSLSSIQKYYDRGMRKLFKLSKKQ